MLGSTCSSRSVRGVQSSRWLGVCGPSAQARSAWVWVWHFARARAPPSPLQLNQRKSFRVSPRRGRMFEPLPELLDLHT